LRGINSKKKWLARKIEESGCEIICLQETKGVLSRIRKEVLPTEILSI
jgi:exonuclease III